MKNKTDRDRFSSGDFFKKLHLELRVPLWVFGLFKVWDYALFFVADLLKISEDGCEVTVIS